MMMSSVLLAAAACASRFGQAIAGWPFNSPLPFSYYSARGGQPVASPDEVVNFFVIGDWGAQPHQTFPPNGGSLHNSCPYYPDSPRCQKNSPEWNREETAQRAVMERMKAIASKLARPLDWVVNVGDNFYFEGVVGGWHWHWRDTFERMYSDAVFHVPFLSVLGNHDYGGDCCAMDLFGGAKEAFAGLFSTFFYRGQAHPTAQMAYDTEKDWSWPAPKKTRWVMPDFNWTKVIDLGAYKVQYFAIDTNIADISKQCFRCGGCSNSGTAEEVLKLGCEPGNNAPGQCICFFTRKFHQQLDWLENELKKSQSDNSVAWRFFVAHHPWNFLPRDASGLPRLLSMFKQYKVQVFFAGHVHSMRHDIIENSINMVMTGSSGGYEYDGGNAPAGDPLGTTVWSSDFMDYGFAHVEMTKHQLTVTYVNDQGIPRKKVTIAAEPQVLYEAQPWTVCDNACGIGRQTRSVKCIALDSDGFSRGEVDMTRCAQEGVEKPGTTQSCFARISPAISFCTSCNISSCFQCAAGFAADGVGGCRKASEVVLMEFEVVAPPTEDWRSELSGLLSTLVRRAVASPHILSAVNPYAVIPRLRVARKERVLASAEHLADAESYGMEIYTVRAAMPVPSLEDAHRVADALLRTAKNMGPTLPIAAFDETEAEVRAILSAVVGQPDGKAAANLMMEI
eukprot:TRINITY_DN43245_c0_g1_i1.p1 TRINITY_DN43245_c0_g1~~TRINITY_DN43245_c0_g1_i1.p1  ORF type:complete len:677 (-),score=102.70 TRINITY_DN43245_c0_g1_i1:30-2060(-)